MTDTRREEQQGPKSVTLATRTFKDMNELMADKVLMEHIGYTLGGIKRNKSIQEKHLNKMSTESKHGPLRLKRTPLDSLEEMGYLDSSEKIHAEYRLITIKSSGLSGNLRNVVQEIIHDAIRSMLKHYSVTLTAGKLFSIKNTSHKCEIIDLDFEKKIVTIQKTMRAAKATDNTGYTYKSKVEEWPFEGTVKAFYDGKYIYRPMSFIVWKDYPNFDINGTQLEENTPEN